MKRIRLFASYLQSSLRHSDTPLPIAVSNAWYWSGVHVEEGWSGLTAKF